MKKSLTLTISLLLFIFASSNAQQKIQFQESFAIHGSYDGLCMQEIECSCANTEELSEQEGSQRGYIIITDSYALIKTDLKGNILWSEQFTYPYSYSVDYSTFNFCGGFSDYVLVTSDCGFLITGSVVDSNRHLNYNLIKTDMGGNLQWSKQYEPPVGDSLFNCIYTLEAGVSNTYWGKVGVKARQTDDNGYIILGQMNSKTSDITHFQMIKTNSTGDVEWTKYYDGNIFTNSFYSSVQICSNIYDIELAGSGPSKGFILLGQVIDSTEWNDYYVLIRTDSLGSVMWSKKYLTEKYAEPEAGVAIKETKDNGFVITGLGGGGSETIVFKTDSIGKVQWFKRYSRSCNNLDEFITGNSIRQTYDGGYIIGCSHPGSGLYEAVMLKIDIIGDFQWLMSYQRNPFGNVVGEACSAIQTSDSGYAFCGSIGAGYFTNVFFVKTDKNGYSGCYDTLLPLCIYSDSLVESTFGDTINVSVNNSSINQTITVPNITVTNYCLSGDTSGINNCLPSGINEIKEPEVITLSPNPATNQLTIHTSSFHNNEAITVSIMNVLGQVASRPTPLQRRGEDASIDVSEIAAGIYFVQVVGEKDRWTGKFVKE